jgi:hypothetical protein
VPIEQAVFTSARTDRAAGYQLLSRSCGLAESDARELSVWGPSHGSLLEQSGQCASTNFFRLASGASCVSRTTMAGAEYSGRGGKSVYTQFLVVPADVMARFANNPFAILRAAAASGALCVHETVPESLEPIELGGRAPVVELSLLAQLVREPGAAALATLVQTALASERLAIFSDVSREQLIAALINLLPVECRMEFSFSTGLKFSPSRAVRISSLPNEESAWRALARRGITLLRLENAAPSDDVRLDGWAAWLAETLAAGKLSVLAGELEQPRPGLTCSELGALGEQLRAASRMSKTRCEDAHARTEQTDDTAGGTTATARAARQRADQPHAGRPGGVLLDAPARPSYLDELAEKLAEQPPEVLELLERIDDLVFAAISGDAQSLAELETLWPTVAGELDADLVEQSREQYLRCALAICSDAPAGQPQRPERALAAVDVLCVLFEE